MAVGLVGGADLDQSGSRGGDHVRQAEGAADLDELPARDDDLTALCQSIDDEEDGGGVVVDDHGRFGSGELAEEGLDVGVA
ncbi:hypothetical protein D3C72_2048500 [compost metagenome]